MKWEKEKSVMKIINYNQVSQFVRSLNVKDDFLNVLCSEASHLDYDGFELMAKAIIVKRLIEEKIICFDLDNSNTPYFKKDLIHALTQKLMDYYQTYISNILNDMKLKTKRFIELLYDLADNELKMIRKSDVTSSKFKRNKYCFYITVKLGSTTVEFLICDLPKKETTYNIISIDGHSIDTLIDIPLAKIDPVDNLREFMASITRK